MNGLIDLGLSMNIRYLKYYKNFETNQTTPTECENILSNEFRAANRSKITTKAHNDPDSRLGVYLLVNPNLVALTQRDGILEFERILLTEVGRTT